MTELGGVYLNWQLSLPQASPPWDDWLRSVGQYKGIVVSRPFLWLPFTRWLNPNKHCFEPVFNSKAIQGVLYHIHFCDYPLPDNWVLTNTRGDHPWKSPLKGKVYGNKSDDSAFLSLHVILLYLLLPADLEHVHLIIVCHLWSLGHTTFHSSVPTTSLKYKYTCAGGWYILCSEVHTLSCTLPHLQILVPHPPKFWQNELEAVSQGQGSVLPSILQALKFKGLEQENSFDVYVGGA